MVALTHPDGQLADRLFETGHLASGNPKQVPEFRLCPSCSGHMQVIFKTEIYECKECRVFATEPA
jgi:hypothetical protein